MHLEKLPGGCCKLLRTIGRGWTLPVVVFGLILGCTSKGSEQADSTQDGIKYKTEIVATGLNVPWSMAFQGNDLYVTERSGRLKVFRKGGSIPAEIHGVPEVHDHGEGGLMGLAFHPDFKSTRRVYLSHTYSTNEDVYNRVVSFRLVNDSLTQEKVIVDKLPGAAVHNGCRIRFGPDKKLYITTGDGAQREIAQSLESLGGKTLRVNDDGSIPSDNPFKNSPVYSIGHRNAQGLDWSPESSHLFQSEHGPSGFDGPGGGDEINVVLAGKNYGWPLIHHQKTQTGMESPIAEFTPAIAPSGASFAHQSGAFYGNFFVAALRGRHLLRVRLNGDDVRGSERMLENVFGRIRDVVEGPDGLLYFCTSNRDGRGTPNEDDDRIVRIVVIQ